MNKIKIGENTRIVDVSDKTLAEVLNYGFYSYEVFDYVDSIMSPYAESVFDFGKEMVLYSLDKEYLTIDKHKFNKIYWKCYHASPCTQYYCYFMLTDIQPCELEMLTKLSDKPYDICVYKDFSYSVLMNEDLETLKKNLINIWIPEEEEKLIKFKDELLTDKVKIWGK